MPARISNQLREALRSNPLDPVALFNQGAVYHNAGEAMRAGGLFRRAVIVNPRFVTAVGHLVRHRAAADGPATGMAILSWMLCLVPLSGQVRALACQYQFELDHFEFSARAGMRALMVDPANPGVCRLLGLSFASLQLMPEAEMSLARSCVILPDWTDALLAWAGARFAINDNIGAIEAAQRAQLAGGDEVECLLLIARATLALDRRGDAEALLDQVVAMDRSRAREVEIAKLTMTPADYADLLDAKHRGIP